MLELQVSDGDNEVALEFEHSLLSLSKWESKNRKPFLATPMKESIEMIDYFQDMMLTDADPTIIYRLSPDQLDQLANYVNDNPTASSVPKEKSVKGSNEIVTSELIYYWMTALKINWEAQTWHLARLMMLVEITNYKSQPPKKQSQAEMMSDWESANARNQELYGHEG